MAGTFALTAIPRLLPEGDHKGHLEYVTFITTDTPSSSSTSCVAVIPSSFQDSLSSTRFRISSADRVTIDSLRSDRLWGMKITIVFRDMEENELGPNSSVNLPGLVPLPFVGAN